MNNANQVFALNPVRLRLFPPFVYVCIYKKIEEFVNGCSR